MALRILYPSYYGPLKHPCCTCWFPTLLLSCLSALPLTPLPIFLHVPEWTKVWFWPNHGRRFCGSLKSIKVIEVLLQRSLVDWTSALRNGHLTSMTWMLSTKLFKGMDGNWTHDLWFTRPTPYHLATTPSYHGCSLGIHIWQHRTCLMEKGNLSCETCWGYARVKGALAPLPFHESSPHTQHFWRSWKHWNKTGW